MKQGKVIAIAEPKCRLRFDGYQKELFEPEKSAWTVMCPRSAAHGARIYFRKGVTPREIELSIGPILDRTVAMSA